MHNFVILLILNIELTCNILKNIIKTQTYLYIEKKIDTYIERVREPKHVSTF